MLLQPCSQPLVGVCARRSGAAGLPPRAAATARTCCARAGPWRHGSAVQAPAGGRARRRAEPVPAYTLPCARTGAEPADVRVHAVAPAPHQLTHRARGQAGQAAPAAQLAGARPGRPTRRARCAGARRRLLLRSSTSVPCSEAVAVGKHREVAFGCHKKRRLGEPFWSAVTRSHIMCTRSAYRTMLCGAQRSAYLDSSGSASRTLALRECVPSGRVPARVSPVFPGAARQQPRRARSGA